MKTKNFENKKKAISKGNKHWL